MWRVPGMKGASDPAAPIIRAAFAIPGDIATPTGGYGYARRLLAEANDVGLDLIHLELPGGFPEVDDPTLAETARVLSAAPPGTPILVDGLALGVLPPDLIAGVPGTVVALCHHPLALETGIEVEAAVGYRASERAALVACQAVIATSEATAAILRDQYEVPADRLTVAPPGTDPAPHAKGSGGPGVAILSVGSLTPRKGHDRLITALAAVTDLDWRLTIVGPADRDRVHSDALEAAIQAAGLAGRVTLAGALNAAALDAAYHRADLFALASRYEGFGMTYTEAMARGLPVIGCASGAVAEATRGAALLVGQGDDAGLRDALRRMIADADARHAHAERCHAAAAHFTRWPETAAIVAGVLREVSP